MSTDTWIDAKNHLWHFRFDFARNFQLFIPHHPSRLHTLQTIRNTLQYGFFICVRVWKTWRRSEVHDEWNIYFKTTTVFVISDFCVVDLSLLTQKKVSAWDGVRRKTHGPLAGGRRLLTSTVRHELCALYRRTGFELIELLTDITMAAAQDNKSLACECKQAEEQIRTRKKWSIKWLRCYNKFYAKHR